MKKIHLLVLGVVVSTMVFIVPAFAMEESTSQDSGDSSQSEITTEELKKAQEKRREEARQKSSEAKEKAQQKREELKKQAEEKKVEIKAEICEKKKANLQKAVTNMSQNSPKVLEKINSVYDKVVDFKTEKNLDVENYDSLVSSVENAKGKATTDVETARGFNFTLDCENQNVGEQLESARSSAKTAKESLKEYRSALKELIKAIKQAAESVEGGSQNE